MTQLQSSPLILILLGGFALFALRVLFQNTTTWRARRRLIAEFDCKPPPKLPQKDLIFGLDMLFGALRAIKSKSYLGRIQRLYEQNGNTFSSYSLGSKFIHTIEPENAKAVLSTYFNNFGITPGRKAAFFPLLGQSILISDGVQWKRSRAFLRPAFERSRVGDLAMLENHVENFIKAIPRNGATVDIAELLFRLTADLTTDFMFGESLGSLVQSESLPTHFLQAFHDVGVGCEERWRRGKLADFLPHTKFHRSVKHVHDFIDKHVEKALEHRRSQITESRFVDTDVAKGRYILLHELGKTTDDRKLLRGELLTVFLAGRDTTASLICNIFFVLARRPDIWRKLRAEVKQLDGRKPTFEEMSRMDYVRYCLNECE